MKKGLLVLAAGAVLFTACGSSSRTDRIADPIENVGSANTEVAAFVSIYEAQNPGTVAQFCFYVGQLGETASRDAFVQGFVVEYPDYSYANQVFDEIISRC